MGIRVKDCPVEPQTMSLPWPSAELPQGEGKMEDLQAGGKETERGREIVSSCSREGSLLLSMALGTYFSYFFSPVTINPL